MKRQMTSALIAVSLILALISCDELINEGIDNQNRKHVPAKLLFGKYISDWELYEINPDGTGEKQLTYMPSSGEFAPNWSPDGEYIIFVSNMSGSPEIYIARKDMTGMKALTSGGGATAMSSPAWSPDGNYIAFCSDKGVSFRQIFVMDKYGNDIRLVTADTFNIYSFSWGIDSKHLCYDGSGLHVINIDGTGDYAIPGTASFAGPTYSPDGKYIYAQDGNFIWRMNSDGTNQVNLTGSHGNSSHGHVALSPDGSRIFYMADVGGGIVHIFRWIDYTNKQQMTFSGTYNEYLAFKVR